MDLEKVVNVDDDWIGGGFDGRFLKSYSENEVCFGSISFDEKINAHADLNFEDIVCGS